MANKTSKFFGIEAYFSVMGKESEPTSCRLRLEDHPMRRDVMCQHNLSNARIFSVIGSNCAAPDSAMIGSKEQLLVTILLRGLAPKFPAVFAQHDATHRNFQKAWPSGSACRF